MYLTFSEPSEASFRTLVNCGSSSGRIGQSAVISPEFIRFPPINGGHVYRNNNELLDQCIDVWDVWQTCLQGPRHVTSSVCPATASHVHGHQEAT